MFFPKLRRKAKWVFAFLALAFALSFVVAGVGTGFGSGFGDYLSELFNRQPDSSVSIEEARAAVAKNPRDSEAQLTLANAFIQEGQSDQAIEALVKYTGDVKNDEDALQQLAALYLTQANEAQQRAAGAQVEGAQAFFSSEIRNPESKVTQALPVGPVTQLEQTDAGKTYSDALTQAQSATKEAAIWVALTSSAPGAHVLLRARPLLAAVAERRPGDHRVRDLPAPRPERRERGAGARARAEELKKHQSAGHRHRRRRVSRVLPSMVSGNA